MAQKNQVAVGIKFSSLLEVTFDRGECLQERIVKIARTIIKIRNPEVDYDSMFVILHGISYKEGDIEVVLDITDA